MDHAIYTAMVGASQSLEKQVITTNNLANASTPGFKAQLAALRAVPINGPTLQTRTLVVAFYSRGGYVGRCDGLHRAFHGYCTAKRELVGSANRKW